MVEWSKQQQAIFLEFREGKGNVVIRARAGTGKTTTAIEGIAHAPEKRILVCAFNKKIAVELADRLRHPGAEAKTLHALGNAVIRARHRSIRLDDGRPIRLAKELFGRTTPDDALRAVAKLAALAKGACPFAAEPRELIDLAIDHDINAGEYAEDGYGIAWLTEGAIRLMKRAANLEDQTIDFDDMIFAPVRNGWAKRSYDLVVVDECQDMNAAQIALAQNSCKKKGRIFVIGDDRQAIYGFRGADSGSIDRLKTELKATELPLTTTYRCGKSIVRLAAQIVPDFEAGEGNIEGSVMRVDIDRLIGLAKPGEFILSRLNAPLVTICLRLLRAGKPANIEGRSIGANLKATVRRVARGAAAKEIPAFLAGLAEWENEQRSYWINALKDREKTLENKLSETSDKAEVIRALCDGLATPAEIDGRIQTLFVDGKREGVTMLSSIHRSKGLEADTVYVLASTLREDGTREEENLRYVAITRAKKLLVLVDGDVGNL